MDKIVRLFVALGLGYALFLLLVRFDSVRQLETKFDATVDTRAMPESQPPVEAAKPETHEAFSVTGGGWAIDGETPTVEDDGSGGRHALAQRVRSYLAKNAERAQAAPPVSVLLGSVRGSEDYLAVWPFSLRGRYSVLALARTPAGSQEIHVELSAAGSGMFSRQAARDEVVRELAVQIGEALVRLRETQAARAR